MTANEYIVLLWLHVYGHPPESEPWVENALQSLDNRNMIIRQGDRFEIGARGDVLIEHLKKMPLPAMKWVMP
jgi:hypothetical protein